MLGHVGFLSLCVLLASFITPKAPALDVIRVDLAQLELPREVEKPKPKPEAPKPEPEPEPEPPAPPVESARKVPDLTPDSLKTPEPEIAKELKTPEPEIPPRQEPAKPKPKPAEPVDLPEPDAVKPAEQESAANPVDETAPEAISDDTSMRMRAPEGMSDYYFALLRRKIARRWDPDQASTRGRRGVETTIRFRVGNAGQIFDAEILSGSGLSVFDRKCLAAVLAANPLPVPPAQYVQSGSLPIELIFTYNP